MHKSTRTNKRTRSAKTFDRKPGLRMPVLTVSLYIGRGLCRLFLAGKAGSARALRHLDNRTDSLCPEYDSPVSAVFPKSSPTSFSGETGKDRETDSKEVTTIDMHLQYCGGTAPHSRQPYSFIKAPREHSLASLFPLALLLILHKHPNSTLSPRIHQRLAGTRRLRECHVALRRIALNPV